jgi:pimeloyl-ACP methyl ester carboxylesterase
VPAVAFAGTDDQIDPSLYENARRRYAKAYEVIKVPGGHFMHREHPKPFIDALLRVVAPFAS